MFWEELGKKGRRMPSGPSCVGNSTNSGRGATRSATAHGSISPEMLQDFRGFGLGRTVSIAGRKRWRARYNWSAAASSPVVGFGPRRESSGGGMQSLGVVKHAKLTPRIALKQSVNAPICGELTRLETAMSWVRVPDVDREDARRLLRERDTLVKERTRLNNRIKGLLQLHGIFDLAPRKPDFLERLASARTGYGAPLPPRARAEIERAVALLRLVEGHIDMIEAEKRALLKAGRKAQDASDLDGTAMIAALTRIHGIGLNDATLLAGEVFYRDFRNRRESGSWAGLTSVLWASGDVDHDLGISKAGPSHVRKHMIQMAWRWLKLRPESAITKWFHAYVARDAGGGRDRRARKRARSWGSRASY